MPGRRDDIQGLRAIAVIAVVAYHAHLGFSGGFVGVDVFFVISGYVITRLLMRELQASGSIEFRRFFKRRVRRILPALAVMLAVVMPLSILLAPLTAQVSTARTGVSAALFNANNYLALFGATGGYFDLGAQANSLLHTWSLSVEEQFYLVFPALLLVGWWAGSRRRQRTSGVAAVLAAMVAVSFALSLLLQFGAVDPDGHGAEIAFYSAPSRAWEFAVGGLLALVGPRCATLAARVGSALVPSGLGLIAAAVFWFDDTTTFPGIAVLLPVVGAALVIVGGERSPGGRAVHLLSNPSLDTLGDLSYGWYLWHWPLIVFAQALFPTSSVAKPAAALLALPVAWLSSRFVEQPIRHSSTMSGRRTIALAMACITLPVAAGAGLEAGHRRLVSSSIATDFSRHLDYSGGCDDVTALADREPDRCVWMVPDAVGEVVLIGDSNAGQFSEGVLAAARTYGIGTRLATSSGCPFVRLEVWTEGTARPECRAFVDGSVQSLVTARPRMVIIASASDQYIESARFEFGSVDGTRRFETPEAKAEAWGDALESVLSELREAGIAVLVVHPVPRFPPWKPIAMAPLRLLAPASQLEVLVPRPQALAERERALAIEQSVAKRAGASTLDVFDELCPADPCSTRGDSIWLNLDDGHISVAASERLAPRFVAAITDVLGPPAG